MKFIKSIIIAVALCAPVLVQAQSGQTLSFINGYNLAVSASNTNSFGLTNTYASGFTVTNSGTYPYVSAYSPIYKTNASAFSDVTLWADRDGSTPSVGISVDMFGLNASFTNIATFRLAAVPASSESFDYQAVTFLAATAAQNQFVFQVTGNGTNHVVISTNFPSGVLQGARRLRLTAIEWTNAGTNGTVVGTWLNGYKPAGAE